MDIPTSITLDAQGNANAIFVFKAGSTLKLESGASVLLVNGAQAANVFWVVGTSFTSVWNGIISNMVGTIMAADSITLGGGTLVGRALAQTAAVTMSTTETITVPVSTATAGPAIPVVFTGIANVNVVEWAGLVLAPPTNFGTAPTGLVIGGNVSLFAGYSALVVDASGNLKVDVAAGSVTAILSGSVTVGNFPAVQPVSGSVAVTNFPAIQPISGSVTALISGSVTVGNFPALQNVNVTEWDGLVLAPPTKFGTAPSGLVIGGNVDIFAGYTALVADGSGNLMVNINAGSVNAIMEDLDFFGVYHPVAGDTTGKLRVTGATMNPTIVQGSLAQGAITQVAIASTTCVKAFPKAVQLGDTLVVLASSPSVSGGVTVTDSLNLQWQTAVVGGSTSAQLIFAFFAVVTVAGTETITLTGPSSDIAMALYEVEGAGAVDLVSIGTNSGTGTSASTASSVSQENELGFVVIGVGAGTISQTLPPTPAPMVFDSGNIAVAGASILKNFGALSIQWGSSIVSTNTNSGNITNAIKLNLGASVTFVISTFAFRPAAIQVNASGSNLSVMSPTNSMSDAVPAASLSGFLNPSYDTRGNITTVIAAEGPMLFNGSTFDRQREALLPNQIPDTTTGTYITTQPGIAATSVVSGPAGAIQQSVHGVSTGSVASLGAPGFTGVVSKNNSIVVIVSVGNGSAPTVTDNATVPNVYKLVASQLGPASAFGVYIFYAIATANTGFTVTASNTGAGASMAIEAYEVGGLLSIAAQQPDQTATAVGTSATAASVALNPQYDNEISFSGVALGTAAQTITPAAGWINDSGQLNPVTPAGLFSMVSMSQFIPDYESVIPQATFTSEPWAIASASFRPISLGVADNNRICLDTPTGDAQTISTASTVNGVTQVNRHNSGAFITILTGTVTGTLPTLTLQLQWSPNNGVTWLNFGAPISGSTNLQSNGSAAFVVYPSLLTGLTLGTSGTGAAATLVAAPLPRLWRISYTVGGSASPTFPITSFVNYVL